MIVLSPIHITRIHRQHEIIAVPLCYAVKKQTTPKNVRHDPKHREMTPWGRQRVIEPSVRSHRLVLVCRQIRNEMTESDFEHKSPMSPNLG